MSFAEIKDGIASLTPEQRLELAALITHLNRVEDPAWEAELDRRLAAMEGGYKTTQAEMERLHRDLSTQGR